MKFKKQFKEAHPETIGETDSHFDKSNYIDWIDKEYTQLKADKSELLEMLEVAKEKLHRCNDTGTSTSILANEITELLNKLK